jgi:hypothetical protein
MSQEIVDSIGIRAPASATSLCIDEARKWWLTPIVLFLILMSLLIVLTQGSAVSQFIYALF